MASGGSSRRRSRSSNRQVEPAPRRRTRPLRMRASSPVYDSSDDDLPEMVLPPAPAPAPAPRTRSLRMHASPPDDGRRRYRPRPRRVARAPPPVVQEREREPPAPHQPAPPQQIIYLLGCPPDVITARGGPGGRTVVGFRCKRITSLRTAAGEDAAALIGALIMCTCHGASFTQAEFLLHAGANPDSNITAYPWLGEEIELPPPGTAGGAQL